MIIACRSVLVAVLAATCGLAQSDTGSLSGRIVDATGAVVAGAKISAKNDATGMTIPSASNQDGVFQYPSLPIGSYTVEAEHPGFKKIRQTGLRIDVATRTTVSLSLSLGDTQQTVEVKAEAPLLSTETSDTGTVFQPKFMKDAPLFVNGGFRNPENFISYVPGVNNGQQDSSINGGARRSKEILIDGASHTNPESGGVAFVANGGIGSVEMFGEFKVLTSNFSAEYGRSGGGIEVFVTKSGANEIHGTAFDFLRNDKLDAAGWTVNQRRPFLGKSKVRQNEYGFAVGGPVFIPKLYNGRNRTFWFFTWNGYRQNNGGGTGVAGVPTARMKQGDFSELGARLIYDPASLRTVGGQLVRDPFQSNLIPKSRWSSVSSKIIPLIPDPTGPGISANYATSSLTTVDRNIYSVKLDHSFSDRNRISGLYSWQRLNQLSQGGLPGPLASGSITHDLPDTSRLNHDFNFTPTLFNHFTFGVSRYQNVFNQLPDHLKEWPTQLGLKGVATNGSQSFPGVQFTDSLTSFGNFPKNRGAQQNWTYQAVDSVTWVKGRHEFRFGGEWRRGRTFQDPFDDSYAQGLFNFSSLQTANPASRGNSGYSFGSFLLGGPNDARRDYNTKGVNIVYGYRGAYVQDNFKVNSKLTLNLGIRYEVFVPRTDTNLTLSAFDPSIRNPAAGNRLGALSFAGAGPGRNGRVRFGDVYWDNFGPRIGAAYRLNDQTVLRAGYGMYYSAANGNTGGGCFPCGWGVSASPTPTSPDGVSQAFNWDNGFLVPTGFQLPPIIDPSYANGQTVLVLSKEDGVAGRIQNWQVNIQRELPRSFLLDIAYIGSKGSRLNSYVPYNQVDPKNLSLGSLLSASITDPRVTAAGFTLPYPGFTGTLAQSLRPYPQYNNIVHTYLGTGGTSYHALQTKLEKRYSSLTLLVAHTWEKNLEVNGGFTQTGNGTPPQDQYNLQPEKYLSVHDIPQTLNLVYAYDLPFGRGHKFLNGGGRAVNAVVGGWTIAGIQQYRSGTLIQVGAPVNTLGTGVLFSPALRAITTGQNIRTGVDRTALDPNNPAVRWLNRDAFAIPGPYQFGTAAPFLNQARNPPFFTEALSIVKHVKLSEKGDVEYRADISNLFNRTSFGGINVNLSDPNFGRPTGVQNGPRIIQMALRLNF